MADKHPFSDIAWDVTEPEYRADPALSYSTLQRYERNGRFRALPTLEEKQSSPSLTFGSVVDALVTGGYGEFDNLFMVADFPEISEALQNIATVLFERYGKEKNFDDILDDELAQVGQECNYYAGSKYTAYRSKLIRENCREYYNILSSATDKTLISQKDYNDALACKEAFLESPYTQGCFTAEIQRDQELYYQLKFKGIDEQTGIIYRCMADIIKVCHLDKIVYPFDVKTSSKPEEDFYKSYLEWLYNLQSRNYWRLIRKAMDKDPYYKEFKLADYTFLVVNRNTRTPLAWRDTMTQVQGDVVYKTASGRTYTIRDPYTIGREIVHYKLEGSRYPDLEVGYSNSITESIIKKL